MGSIDFMDNILTPSQYSEISSNPAITTGFVAETEMVEYDLNNYVAPFNNTDYRMAFEFMTNKSEYLNTYYPGGGTPMYAPIDFNPFGQAADAYCRALYPTNFLQAYKDLCQSGYPLVAENSTNGFGGANQPTANSGCSTWFFPSPYPTVASTTYDGLGDSSSPYQLAVPNATIQIIARTERPERTDQAAFLNTVCGTATSEFTTFVKNYYASNSSFFKGLYALPTIGGVVQYPVINFLDTLMPRASTNVEVMTYYRFQMYTGAWVLDEFQDTLEIWLSSETPQVNGWGPDLLNYDMFNWQAAVTPGTGYDWNNSAGMPDYDYYTLQSLSAVIPGITPPAAATWHNSSMYWAIQAQEELMRDAPLIPMFYYSGYSAVLTHDNYTVNEMGIGFDNWFTFLDAQTPTGTLTWGWQADIENPNPISSNLYSTSSDPFLTWDWDIMSCIYDSMLSVNPYTEAIIPSLATGYSLTVSDPTNPFGPTCSSALMTMRSDAFWQDLPAMTRNQYTLDAGPELNGPITDQQVTPLDVAFTYEYITHDGLYQPEGGSLYGYVYDVGQVVISSVYQSRWNSLLTTYHTKYNGTVVDYPWENATYIMDPAGGNCLSYPITGSFAPANFVQFSSTLSPNQIEIYFTDQPGWLVYYTELAIPILPMYIFSHLAEASWPDSAVAFGFKSPSEYSMVLDPAGANLLFGSGPYVWTGFATGTYTLKAYTAGVSYEGITEDKSYWASANMPSTEVYLNPSRVSGITGQTVNVTLEISDVVNLCAFQAGCTFNPLVVHCLGVFDGGFLGSLGGTEIVTAGSIDNVNGRVNPYNFALNGTGKAPTGSGALLIFEFQINGTGGSEVHLIDWIPFGTNGNLIPTTSIDCSTTSKGVVQIVGNPEGTAVASPYAGFNALTAQTVSTSVNGTTYNGNMSFTIYSPDANYLDNENQGFFSVAIPRALMTCNASNQWYLSLNGVPQSSRVVSENATETFVSLELNYSATGLEQVEILSVYYWGTGQYQTAISTTGKNVSVAPSTCAQVTFANVTTTGALTMNVTQPSSNATGLTTAANSVFVTFQTNATYHGNVTLSFRYNPAGLTLAEQEAIRIWLWNTTSNAWRDITTHVNTTTDTVYGVSPHLSCFGITCTLSLLGSNGQTIQTVIQTPSSPPLGLPIGLEAIGYYNITAIAQYSKPVTIQLAYNASAISPQQAQFLQMWLWNTSSNEWVEIPTRVDTTNCLVYGLSPHLSCFGITCQQPFPAGVAMEGASCSKTIVGQGYNVIINLQIQNQGTSTQSFTVFVYANSTAVYSEQISNLAPQKVTNVTFEFTASLNYGNYSVSACSQPIKWVKVTIPGDVNGDGVVNIRDGALIGEYWGMTVPPAPANVDVGGYGVINIRDGAIIGAHWGQSV
jgi:hypothetical protein